MCLNTCRERTLSPLDLATTCPSGKTRSSNLKADTLSNKLRRPNRRWHSYRRKGLKKLKFTMLKTYLSISAKLDHRMNCLLWACLRDQLQLYRNLTPDLVCTTMSLIRTLQCGRRDLAHCSAMKGLTITNKRISKERRQESAQEVTSQSP